MVYLALARLILYLPWLLLGSILEQPLCVLIPSIGILLLSCWPAGWLSCWHLGSMILAYAGLAAP